MTEKVYALYSIISTCLYVLSCKIEAILKLPHQTAEIVLEYYCYFMPGCLYVFQAVFQSLSPLSPPSVLAAGLTL